MFWAAACVTQLSRDDVRAIETSVMFATVTRHSVTATG